MIFTNRFRFAATRRQPDEVDSNQDAEPASKTWSGMDGNPYRSPQTQGAPVASGNYGKYFRVLIAIFLASCGVPFIAATFILGWVAYLHSDLTSLVFGLCACAIAFLLFFVAIRIPE
jgi:hypothetical protein